MLIFRLKESNTDADSQGEVREVDPRTFQEESEKAARRWADAKFSAEQNVVETVISAHNKIRKVLAGPGLSKGARWDEEEAELDEDVELYNWAQKEW